MAKKDKSKDKGKAVADKSVKNSKPPKLASFHYPLERELAAVGLRVKKITADGNCFFRSVCDQMEGTEHGHADLRARVVAFMRDNEADFAPFVEDDQSFSAYIARMKREGVWAGHMELQAASLLLQHNICIYQAGQPRWSVSNFPATVAALHLSYHDGEHYNSIRLADDYGPGPPQPVVVTAAGLASAAAAQGEQCWDAKAEQQVAANTGCDNPALICKALERFAGDIDAAIEYVIEVMGNEVVGEDAAAEGAVAEAAAGAGDKQEQAADEDGLLRSAQGHGGASEAQEPGHSGVDTGAAGSLGATATPGGGNQPSTSTPPPPPAAAVDDDDGGAGNGPCSAAAGAAAVTSCSEAASSSNGQLTPAAGGAVEPGRAAAGAGSDSSSLEPPAAQHPGRSSKKTKPAAAAASGKDAGAAGNKKPSRNKKCVCGSSLKWKNCCGAAAAAAERRLAAAGGSQAAESAVIHLETLSI